MKKITLLFLVTLVSSNLWAASAYDDILKRLTELSQYPDTGLFSLGKNDQGQDIVGLIIGNPNSGMTKHLVVGTHHGNERMSAIVPLLFAEKILAQRDRDAVYFVIPVLNISGYNRNSRQETGADGRSYDANRDYEDACATKVDFKLKSTSLISQLVERENIIGAVTVHGYVGTFTFPWGTTVKPYETQDDALMVDLAKKAVVHNNYKIGTHGGAIYPASGAFEDWAYFKLGVWSFLLEIKNPSSDLNKDANSLVQFFRDVPRERSQNVGQRVNCVARILGYRNDSRP